MLVNIGRKESRRRRRSRPPLSNHRSSPPPPPPRYRYSIRINPDRSTQLPAQLAFDISIIRPLRTPWSAHLPIPTGGLLFISLASAVFADLIGPSTST